MKKIFLLLITACGVLSVSAQKQVTSENKVADNAKPELPDSLKKQWKKDPDLSRWVLDVNTMGGVLMQDLKTANTGVNYLNAVETQTGKLKFTKGMSFGGEVQVGYFFGDNGHFGVGTGLMYFYQQGDITQDKFRVQYQSTDAKGGTFRQIITADQPIKESQKIMNWDIPLVAKYKMRFTRRIGFTADAGILYNLQMRNSYTTNGSFDYEAIYQFNGEGAPVYDHNYNTSNSDWLITKDHIAMFKPNGVSDSMNYLRSKGYNVGLNQEVAKKTGKTDYDPGSFGFLVRPAVNYFFSDKVALNLGVCYIYHPVSNAAENNYHLTDKVGDYTSVTRSVTSNISQSLGGNLGVRVFLGTYHPKTRAMDAISSVDSTNPTICGVADGTIILHGLMPGEPVAVSYIFNGVPQPVHTDTVSPYSTIRLTGLAAGKYTGITVAIGEKTVPAVPVTLVNPPLGFYSQSSINPSVTDACDGAITLHGMHPGLPITVNYSYNGTPHAAYKGTLAKNGTITLPALCPGTYSNIVSTINTCKINGSDVTLKNPAVVTKAPGSAERPDVSSPILFQVNKADITAESDPILQTALYELNEDANSFIQIDGYTDISGRETYNKVLSTRRANAVKSYLQNRGINAKRLIPVGHGINDPISDNSTPEGRAKNRRVQMSLKHSKK